MASRPREPSSAPHPEQWYPIVLGSSLKDQPSKRYYSLRYEFKPASIDTSRPGTLHKGAENKVTVEFANNQPGKPNVAFQGVNEDCKDSEAILFFDGKSFRLERLHRAVKTLRHLRLPGESAASASNLVPNAETRTSPVHLNGHAAVATAADDNSSHRPRVGQEQVEEIVLGIQPEPSAGGPGKKTVKPAKSSRNKPSPAPSPPRKRTSPSLLDIVDDDVVIDIEAAAKRPKPDNTNNTNTNSNNNSVEHIDVNIDDDEGEEHESEYEVEDVDVSDDEEQQQQPMPAAEQPVQPAPSDKPQSSSSSGSSSSGSGSGSGSDSSSDSDGSDDESLGDV